jgi:hypothetical protein
MMLSGTLKRADIVKVGGRTKRSVRCFSTTKAPPNDVGQQQINPLMLEATHKHLQVKPGLCQDEMTVFLHDEFGIPPSIPSISKALKSIGRSKKATPHSAQERNADLMGYYIHNLTEFSSYHLVNVDESGCDTCPSDSFPVK